MEQKWCLEQQGSASTQRAGGEGISIAQVSQHYGPYAHFGDCVNQNLTENKHTAPHKGSEDPGTAGGYIDVPAKLSENYLSSADQCAYQKRDCGLLSGGYVGNSGQLTSQAATRHNAGGQQHGDCIENANRNSGYSSGNVLKDSSLPLEQLSVQRCRPVDDGFTEEDLMDFTEDVANVIGAFLPSYLTLSSAALPVVVSSCLDFTDQLVRRAEAFSWGGNPDITDLPPPLDRSSLKLKVGRNRKPAFFAEDVVFALKNHPRKVRRCRKALKVSRLLESIRTLFSDIKYISLPQQYNKGTNYRSSGEEVNIASTADQRDIIAGPANTPSTSAYSANSRRGDVASTSFRVSASSSVKSHGAGISNDSHIGIEAPPQKMHSFKAPAKSVFNIPRPTLATDITVGTPVHVHGDHQQVNMHAGIHLQRDVSNISSSVASTSAAPAGAQGLLSTIQSSLIQSRYATSVLVEPQPGIMPCTPHLSTQTYEAQPQISSAVTSQVRSIETMHRFVATNLPQPTGLSEIFPAAAP